MTEYSPTRDLHARAASLEAEALSLAERSTVSTEEDRHLDSLLDELEEVRRQIDESEKRQARIDEMKARSTAASERARQDFAAGRIPAGAIDSFNVNTRSNPFDLDDLRSVDPETRLRETRARAIDVIEHRTGRFDHLTDGARQNAVEMLEGGNRDVERDVAELVLQTGTDAYRSAFYDHLRDPAALGPKLELERMTREIHTRAAVQMAGVSGALHLPFELDPSLLINNTGAVNPIRRVFRNVTISGTNVWQTPTTAGITAAVVGESTAFSDNSPTFSSTAITCYKAGAHAFGSWEALGDSGLANELGMLFADAKNRLEASKFTVGTGSSEPQGIVVFASNATSVVAGGSGAANSADLVADDIYNLRANLSPRWRDEAVWLGNLAVAYAIRKMGTSTNFHAFSLDLTQSDTLQLLGRPFYEVSDMDGVVTSGATDFTLIHGSPNAFVTVDRVGMTLAYTPVVTSGSKFPTGESAWTAWWRFGSGGVVADGLRMLKV